jgi:hypothetical protein
VFYCRIVYHAQYALGLISYPLSPVDVGIMVFVFAPGVYLALFRLFICLLRNESFYFSIFFSSRFSIIVTLVASVAEAL